MSEHLLEDQHIEECRYFLEEKRDEVLEFFSRPVIVRVVEEFEALTRNDISKEFEEDEEFKTVHEDKRSEIVNQVMGYSRDSSLPFLLDSEPLVARLTVNALARKCLAKGIVTGLYDTHKALLCWSALVRIDGLLELSLDIADVHLLTEVFDLGQTIMKIRMADACQDQRFMTIIHGLQSKAIIKERRYAQADKEIKPVREEAEKLWASGDKRWHHEMAKSLAPNYPNLALSRLKKELVPIAKQYGRYFGK